MISPYVTKAGFSFVKMILHIRDQSLSTHVISYVHKNPVNSPDRFWAAVFKGGGKFVSVQMLSSPLYLLVLAGG
jgi:hypothetical protein